MINIEPVYRMAGDLYLIVEYGDEGVIQLSFRVIALNHAVRESRVPGIVTTVVSARSLGIVYNPFKICLDSLITKLKNIEKNARNVRELPSRLIKIPLWYGDPWSAECAKAHDVPNNIEFVAEVNNITVEELIRTHSSTDWWVTHRGFLPGTMATIQLDPEMKVTAPRYEVPRTWSPARTVGLGGRSTASYAVVAPGGFQLIGRTPLELYDPKQCNVAFKDDPVLMRPGDRIRFIPISEGEYFEIRKKVKESTYRYEIEEGIYRLKQME